MKIKKITLIFLFCVFQTLMVFSNTWTQVSENGKTLLRDQTGKTCEIFSDIDITEGALERIKNILNTIWSIPGLKGSESRVSIEPGNYFHFIVYPDSLMYKGVEFKGFLPTGLSFRYDSTLFYDLTLKIDDYLPRVSGAYISPDDFLEQLYSVYLMPELYLHGDILLRRIERLEKALMAISKDGLFSKPAGVSDEIVLAVIALNKQNPNVTVSEALATLKEQGIEATKKDVEAVFMVYLGKIE